MHHVKNDQTRTLCEESDGVDDADTAALRLPIPVVLLFNAAVVVVALGLLASNIFVGESEMEVDEEVEEAWRDGEGDRFLACFVLTLTFFFRLILSGVISTSLH